MAGTDAAKEGKGLVWEGRGTGREDKEGQVGLGGYRDGQGRYGGSDGVFKDVDVKD